jgi:hypothetical protein
VVGPFARDRESNFPNFLLIAKIDMVFSGS